MLFHHTTIRNAANILRTGDLLLSYSAPDSPDRLSRRPFYASFSRIRWSGYNYGANNGFAILEVDGDGLKHRYRVRPVDYWQYPFGTSHSYPGADEQEERLMHDSSTVPGFVRHVKSVSVCSNEETDEVRYLAARCSELGIPFYAYSDPAAFKLGNKKKAIETGSDASWNPESLPYWNASERQTRGVRALQALILDPFSESEEVEEMCRRLSGFDWKNVVSSEIHNLKSSRDPEIRKVFEWFTRAERRTGKNVYELLRDAIDKRDRRDRAVVDIRALNGLARIATEGSAPGWGRVTRESLPAYLRPTGHAKADSMISVARELAAANDWEAVATYLNQASRELGQEFGIAE